MANNIPPLLTTAHFVIRPLVPVTLAWSNTHPIHQHITAGQKILKNPGQKKKLVKSNKSKKIIS